MYEQRFNPYAANVAIVKGYFKSGKVLALGIFYLISLGLSILSMLSRTPMSVYYQYLSMMERLGLDSAYLPSYDSDAWAASATGSAVAAILVTAAISILIAVAFILIFAKSRSANPNSNPIAGVIIMHVLSIICFVAAIIIAVMIGIFYLLIVGSTLLSTGNYASESIAILVAVGLLAILAAFMIVFFAAAMKNYYRSIRHSLNTVTLQSKGAVAFGVVFIIMAVFTGCSLIGTVISAVVGSYFSASLLTIASSIVTLVIQILNASIALGYNKYIKRQTLGYNNTPYGGTPNNAYAPIPGAQPTYRDQPYQNQPSVPYNDNFADYNAPQPGTPYHDNFTEYSAPAPQAKPSVCPYCGAPTDSSPFCGNCGNKL